MTRFGTKFSEKLLNWNYFPDKKTKNLFAQTDLRIVISQFINKNCHFVRIIAIGNREMQLKLKHVHRFIIPKDNIENLFSCRWSELKFFHCDFFTSNFLPLTFLVVIWIMLELIEINSIVIVVNLISIHKSNLLCTSWPLCPSHILMIDLLLSINF